MTSKDTLSSGELADPICCWSCEKEIGPDRLTLTKFYHVECAPSEVRDAPRISPRGDSIGSSGGFDKDIGSSAALHDLPRNVHDGKESRSPYRQLCEANSELVRIALRHARARRSLGCVDDDIYQALTAYEAARARVRACMERTTPLTTEARYSGDGGKEELKR